MSQIKSRSEIELELKRLKTFREKFLNLLSEYDIQPGIEDIDTRIETLEWVLRGSGGKMATKVPELAEAIEKANKQLKKDSKDGRIVKHSLTAYRMSQV